MMEPSLTTNYQLPTTKSPLVVIVGETASGKSSMAMDFAERFNGEIISADSWTVYRQFDIGTAKPSHDDQQRVVHHLIDVVDAPDGFNAALYKDLADEAIKLVHSRGKLPILVGGTGLYIDSVLFDYGFVPAVSPAEREVRNNRSLEELLAEAEANKIDLTGIDIRNKRRVIRALETGGQRPTRTEIRPSTLILGIQTERSNLRERITKRVDVMLAAGLEQEVQQLSKEYGWTVEPIKGIGYIEWREYFNGSQSLLETKQRIINSSMNLAKRQRTWFKRNDSIQWVNDPIRAVDLATTFLNKKQ